MKQFYKQKKVTFIVGILAGVVYGLAARYIFESNIATVSFLFLVPIGLGAVPFLFINREQIQSYKKLLFIPWLSIPLLFGLMILFKIEDFLCFFVLAIPFILLGTLIAFLVVFLDEVIKRNKRNKLFGLALLPFLVLPLEKSLEPNSRNYNVNSEIIIEATATTIWDNIVAVNIIKDTEYNPGVLNTFGLPRPVKATVTKKELGGIRTGYFDDGLQFTEIITKYDLNREIAFSIKVDPASCQNKIFQKHVLEGDYFRFENAVYKLTPMPDGKVKLSLSSEYNLTSNVNFYGEFWANIMIQDFQDRLLKVIQKRCEKKP